MIGPALLESYRKAYQDIMYRGAIWVTEDGRTWFSEYSPDAGKKFLLRFDQRTRVLIKGGNPDAER